MEMLGFSAVYRLATDLLGFFQSLAEQGCPAPFRLGPYRAFLVTRPEHVRHVYQREQAGVYINNRFASVTKRVFGDSLLNNDGPQWASQRRMLKPYFTNAGVKQWASLIDRKLGDLADAWERKAGEWLTVDAECAALTQAVMTSVLFGEEVGQTAVAQEAIEAIHVVHQEFVTQTLGLALLGPVFSWLPVPSNRRFNRAIRTIDRIVGRLIDCASRTRQGLIAFLRETVDPDTGRSMDAKLLRDELIALYVAGQETTGIALTWLLYELAKHPEIAEKARKDVLDRREGEVNAEAFPYLWAIVQETLRLHPSTTTLLRYAVRGDRIGEVEIPRGSLVLMSPYVTHRLPDIWPDPERFDPTRFKPGSGAPGVCSFITFGGGRHICLGLNLANRILLQSAVTLLRRFEFYVPNDYRVNPRPGLFLRPEGGCRIQIVSRPLSDRLAAAAGR
ncbi:putative Cytochrome P450 family protein [Methylocaldum szegediense]|uniref:Cytochrome P450 family protein n=2 Tax=Methylocaldum szegediense TaxID=73780 RepID=A0ABM9HZ13_9GAMM|nr:cytochrome P450 [Methylocaldum szegediense]CAI8781078.1 putative Cytochrome P450 family protein [Methylocaldum szegediense]